MGVDFFACEQCHEVVCDAGDFSTFCMYEDGEIREINTCYDCGLAFESEVYHKQRLGNTFVTKHDNGVHKVFDSFQAVCDAVKADPVLFENTHFGIYRLSQPIDKEQFEATGTMVVPAKRDSDGKLKPTPEIVHWCGTTIRKLRIGRHHPTAMETYDRGDNECKYRRCHYVKKLKDIREELEETTKEIERVTRRLMDYKTDDEISSDEEEA